MTNQEMLISYINKLTEDEISSLLEDVALILETKELTLKSPCPYCGSGNVICYGHAYRKQRFLCKKMWTYFRSDYKYHHGKFRLSGICLEVWR